MPEYINLENPKYLEVNDSYYSTIMVVNYSREFNDLLLKTIIDSNIDINISMFYEKQDTYKTIRDLTYHIGNVGVNLKNIGENREDSEIAAFTYSDAKYIRKEIQVNNEELYFLYLYISTFSDDKKELGYLIEKIEGIIQSRGMITKRAYFRQDQAYKACLPLNENSDLLKSATCRNVLSSGLVRNLSFYLFQYF
ncbi:MAG TPA: hypothetical protein PK993_04470 [Clostridia bacterium]|nr:hypothetical protein [Clostridia bacterium]